jgi:hypothetical protein
MEWAVGFPWVLSGVSGFVRVWNPPRHPGFSPLTDAAVRIPRSGFLNPDSPSELRNV